MRKGLYICCRGCDSKEKCICLTHGVLFGLKSAKPFGFSRGSFRCMAIVCHLKDDIEALPHMSRDPKEAIVCEQGGLYL